MFLKHPLSPLTEKLGGLIEMGKPQKIHLASNPALRLGTKTFTSAHEPWSSLQTCARLHQKALGQRSRKGKSKVGHGLEGPVAFTITFLL